MLTRHATGGAVAAAHHLAATAGVSMLEQGGNAVDAAVAAGAVMAVTSPQMCGLGGDLFAVVSTPAAMPVALRASGRAGSGADPDRLRGEGAQAMPFQGDVRVATVPGCIDGLLALHERYARLELERLLRPARRLADDGFPVSASLASASVLLPTEARRTAFGSPHELIRGQRLRVPGVAHALAAVATAGRTGFYEGPPGRDLIRLGGGEFTEEDLARSSADWTPALSAGAFGRRLWTAPPNSQGYLALAGAWIADRLGVVDAPATGRWALALIEAARQAAFDRVAVLHEHADGEELLSETRLAPRAEAIARGGGAELADVYSEGDTTAICTVDDERAGVSLIMSNGANFGCHLVLPESGIFLHNRGLGFSLAPGHPAEYGPGRRPPHTLTPLVATDEAGALDTVLGTMGADAQPQILLQLLARLLVHDEEAGDAIAAPRWALSRERSTGFDTWESESRPLVRLEHDSPPAWAAELERHGYTTVASAVGEHAFGHAQVIRVREDGVLCGAADPRPGDGACVAR
jgi:gamma-glutamyltranspeptidase / glutathione hydrolase